MASSPPSAAIDTDVDCLTPRTKVARMLAEIDDAPTPSPPPRKWRATGSSPAQRTHLRPRSAGPDQAASTAARSEQNLEEAEGIDDTTDDEIRGQERYNPDTDSEQEDVISRPAGRAARRMLAAEKSSPPGHAIYNNLESSQHEPNDEDLYSATPMRKTQRALSGTPLASEHGGLFVSPAKTNRDESDYGSLPINSLVLGNHKLVDLVAQKRAQRLARQEAKAHHPSKRRGSKPASAQYSSPAHASSDMLAGELAEDDMAPVDPNVERILSDAARPTRKASKKALLEMERETQRLARQQALAHQMKVKKKFTTSDLIAKFGYGQAMQPPVENGGDSTAPSSDPVEAPASTRKEPVSTPPSSPPTPFDRQKALVEHGALSKLAPVRQDSLASLNTIFDSDGEEMLPELDDILSSSHAPARAAEPESAGVKAEKKGLKLARLGKKAMAPGVAEDEDDHLEIVQPLPKHLSVFDKVKAVTNKTSNENKAIHLLRHLSRYGRTDSTSRGRNAKPLVNPQVLEARLRASAKAQARQRQEERLAELHAKGIIVQTAEERERETEDFEDLLEKARQEAEHLRKAERKAATMANRADTAEASADESEDDESFVGSGSEGETVPEEDAEEVDGNEVIDQDAEETESKESDAETEGAVGNAPPAAVKLAPIFGKPAPACEVQEVESTQGRPFARKPRMSRVVADADDEDEDVPMANTLATKTNVFSQDDPFAAFGFGAAGGAMDLMSPTQAFNATMQTPTQATQQDSFGILRRIAPLSGRSPTLLEFGNDSQTQMETQLDEHSDKVPSSQVPESQRIQLDWNTQPAPQTPLLARRGSGLSETPGWEPTQDPGLPTPVPALRRTDTLDSIAEEHETQSTVQLRVSQSPAPSAAPQRRGRLVRRQPLVESESEEEAAPLPSKPAQKNAFAELAKRRCEVLAPAEREEAAREMRQMMDEQAEESEDEYAGLGGDDYVAPETAEDQAMIDSSEVNVDERALAAHYAKRQRKEDEERVQQLYKDLTTGALRRRQGATWDLDDDEEEAAVRRRQMRQREEARKRKLLLQDENVKDLVDGKNSKGKDAFLKAIADDLDNDDLLNLDVKGQDSQQAGQTEDSQPSQQPLQEISGNKRRLADGEEHADDRPSAKQRRTAATRAGFNKPTSMLEVRESVSFLLDDPDTAFVAPAILNQSSDSELDAAGDAADDHETVLLDDDDEVSVEEARANDGGFAPNPAGFEDAMRMPPPRLPASQRRTAPSTKTAVVDRLSIKRHSPSAGSEGSFGRSAWSTGDGSGSKAPSLLRRATTIAASAGGTGVTHSNGVSLSRENSGTGGVKMGANKKANLAYQARAEERKAIVDASARRRAENTKRIAEMRKSATVGLGGLTGRWE